MRLLFVPHGETLAGPTRFSNLNKAENTQLSALGLEQAKQAGKICASEAAQMVLTSPVMRARQTANIICSACNVMTPFYVEELREGYRDPTRTIEVITGRDVQTIAVVSHQDVLRSLVSRLTCADRQIDWELQQGTVTALGQDNGHWQVDFMNRAGK